jgi:hypothetical protein
MSKPMKKWPLFLRAIWRLSPADVAFEKMGECCCWCGLGIENPRFACDGGGFDGQPVHQRCTVAMSKWLREGAGGG